MDKKQPSTLPNILPDTDTQLTDQPVSELSERASGTSFDILSRNPSEEYKYNYNPAVCISGGENLTLRINQELADVTKENKISQKKLEGYEKLGEMYHETKEKVQDLKQDVQHGQMEKTLHTEVRTQTKDIASNIMLLCDMMCSSLSEPNSVDTQNLRESILTLAKDVIVTEKEHAHQKKLTETLITERGNLQHELQDLKKELQELKSQTVNQVARPREKMKYEEATKTYTPTIFNQDIQFIPQSQNQQVSDHHIELEQLQQKYREMKNQNKELGRVNNEWETYCHRIQKDLNHQIASLQQKLSKSEEVIRSFTDTEHELQLKLTQLKKETDEKMIKYEEQTTKAIDFAKSQAHKVDELKKKLKMEQLKTEEQDNQIKQLESISEIQVAEIDKLNTEVKRLKEAISRQESSSEAHGSLNLTLDDRNPQRNEQNTVSSLKTEIQVLQQQVTIYKDDFENERRDRERAQSEISTLRIKMSQLSEDFKAEHEDLKRKNRETEALRATRDQDRTRLQKKDDENSRLKSTINRLVAEQSEVQAQVERLQREADYQQPPPYEYVSRQPSNVTGHPVQLEETTQNSTSEWSCSTCTFSNSGDKQKCDMCGNAAPRRYASSEDILPTYPGFASGYQDNVMIDRTEQCDDDIEWVKPAGCDILQHYMIETDNNNIPPKLNYLNHV